MAAQPTRHRRSCEPALTPAAVVAAHAGRVRMWPARGATGGKDVGLSIWNGYGLHEHRWGYRGAPDPPQNPSPMQVGTLHCNHLGQLPPMSLLA